MKIGYARVSTKKQNHGPQRSLLQQDGCSHVFAERRSGKNRRCPQLNRAIARLGPGDILVVFKIDRLTRSVGHLVEIIDELKRRNAILRSLSESVDIYTPVGKFTTYLVGAVAELEAENIGQRTEGAMRFAKRSGKPLGRRSRMTLRQVERARRLAAEDISADRIAQMMDVGRTTVYRALSDDYTPRRAKVKSRRPHAAS